MALNKKGLLAALALALLYLAAYYYLDFKNKILVFDECRKTETGFSFYPREFLRLRAPSDIRFTFNKDIDSVRIIWKEASATAAPTKISSRQWALGVEEEIHIARIDVNPVRPERALTIRLTRTPLFRFFFLLIQSLTVLALAYLAWELASWACGLFFSKGGLTGELQDRLTRASVIAIAPYYLYVLMNLYLYERVFREWNVPLARGLLFNLLLAAFLASAYGAITRFRVKSIVWPVLFSALVLLLWPKFKLEICGDAVEWLRVIGSAPGQFGRYNATTVSFAESASVLLGKGILGLLRAVFSGVDAEAVYTVMGKAQGILYAFILYAFVFRQPSLSARQKSLSYVLVAALPASAFFLGFPEFTYYALPCLLLSLILADRYLRQEGGDHRLLLASLVLSVGGLFHGSAWFSLPALLVLPFLKWKAFPRRRAAFFYLSSAAWLAGGLVIPVLLLAAVNELAGTKIVFYTALGGAGADKFVKIFPTMLRYWNDKNFAENAYLFLRGWVFLIGFPLPLLALGLHPTRKESRLALFDVVLLLAALGQLAIVFFWGFDLNIKDYDLYMVPQFLLMLVLIKKTVSEKFCDGREGRAIALIILLALTSPIGPFLAMTSR